MWLPLLTAAYSLAAMCAACLLRGRRGAADRAEGREIVGGLRL